MEELSANEDKVIIKRTCDSFKIDFINHSAKNKEQTIKGDTMFKNNIVKGRSFLKKEDGIAECNTSTIFNYLKKSNNNTLESL